MTISTVSFNAINVGSSANDGTGDDLRLAFQKVNANFGWIGNTGFSAANITVATELDVPTANVSSSLITGGKHIELGYQQVKPTANTAVTVNSNVNRLLIHPTGAIVSFGANVTLPNVRIDGTIVNISSNVTIAQLDVRSGWNGVVSVSPFGNVSSVTAGTNTRYMYIAADSQWYKIA
jgi:hypothetical protein